MAIRSTGLTEAGLRSAFFDRFNSSPRYIDQLASRIDSQLPEEKYRWLHHLPMARAWGSGRRLVGALTESYGVGNLRYELSILVGRTELVDDQTGQIRLRIQELAEIARSHPDYLLAQLLNYGATAGYIGYDGKTFFATDHETYESGQQSNSIEVAVSDPANVTTADMKKAIATAIQTMMGYKNEQGDSLRLAPSGIKIIPPANLYFTTLEAVGATMISSTDNVLRGGGDVVPLPDITGTDAFYVLKTDAAIRPFIFQVREDVKFQSVADGSELEFRDDQHMYGTYARYRVAYARWALAIKVTFV